MASISHHYNPVVYLREFASNKKKVLWEYDLMNGSAKESTPQECGCEDYYHSLHSANGVRDDNSLEKSFRSIENRLPKLFQAVRNIRSEGQIAVPIRANMLMFAALLCSRSPKTLHRLQNFVVRQASLNLNVNLTTTREQTLKESLSALGRGDLQQLLGRMKWVFMRAPEGKHFFTSDDPVCCWPPLNSEPLGAFVSANEHAEITFPLTRRICAFGNWKASFVQEAIPLSGDDVDVINSRTLQNGYRFVYGPSNDSRILNLVENIAQLRKTP